MTPSSSSPQDIKRRLRQLKRLEIKLRFGAGAGSGGALFWDQYFDLRDKPAGGSKYTWAMLCAMDREAFKAVTEEYLARIYEAWYWGNTGQPVTVYDSAVLAQLNLPADAREEDIKKRFRELAKACHPDTGGDAAQFIALMRAYEKLTGG